MNPSPPIIISPHHNNSPCRIDLLQPQMSPFHPFGPLQSPVVQSHNVTVGSCNDLLCHKQSRHTPKNTILSPGVWVFRGSFGPKMGRNWAVVGLPPLRVWPPTLAPLLTFRLKTCGGKGHFNTQPQTLGSIETSLSEHMQMRIGDAHLLVK
jgi:hypothetical protein